LKLLFDGVDETKFNVASWSCQLSGVCFFKTLNLNEQQEGTIVLPNFGRDYNFLTLIVSTQERRSDFGSSELAWPFSFEVSMGEDNEKTISELQARIALLKSQIAKLQAELKSILAQKTENVSCREFGSSLYLGTKNDEVRCLQEFLKGQGPEIYPEGLVTGYFGPLTRAAVIRFQERYADEILAPWGLTEGTGFVGSTTRAKLNALLGG
jgi:peptidoglycan hydrolase-like protein with peptidoglycan-binding domain